MGNLLCGAGTLLFRLRCVGGILLAADAGANEDRKSTRLNSSHDN